MSMFVSYYVFRHLDTVNSITMSSSALATRKLKAQFEDHFHDCTEQHVLLCTNLTLGMFVVFYPSFHIHLFLFCEYTSYDM